MGEGGNLVAGKCTDLAIFTVLFVVIVTVRALWIGGKIRESVIIVIEAIGTCRGL